MGDGLPPMHANCRSTLVDDDIDRMVTTSPRWWVLVNEAGLDCSINEDNNSFYECPAWLDAIGLVLLSRYISKHQTLVFTKYLKACREHSGAIRAAYRLGGPEVAIRCATQLVFASGRERRG